jgi:hypothetical protein
VDILARSSKDSLDVFDQEKTDSSGAAAEKATLKKDPAMRNLLVGRFADGENGLALPAKPVGELTLWFNDNKAIDDLWLALMWNG